ncbi:hypothetical protein [Oryzicola mucosus]|uniref:Uncharacterized protein n=1 Tax=Oryzicola mucosus TaxID=2767425 RepID=A0A8J6PTM8_9HYPH|nr:hypothetical protein [Oryzicola mucosus]MBD0413282.1 hypothetical protein [Oryzicola mucosus]
MSDGTDLESRIADLERMVTELRRTVLRLEAKLDGAEPDAKPPLRSRGMLGSPQTTKRS